ncbi:MAG: D-ribose ABC transporter substrate-binding protein [Clostridiales bacterium]|nr:substrate-binding domain-containing protein [Bacillota bacterium]NLL54805.1 D-ribose ABC transporter substrate-binding protein [Clostridiales bacterium]
MKKILATLICLLLVLTVAPAMAEDITIGALLSDTSNTFFVTMADAIEAKGAELGVKTIILDGANDSAKDVTNMEDLIAAGVDFVLYNPVDSDAAAAVVEKATAAGIPVISIDRSVNGAEVVSHIASDNVYGGKIATEMIIELMGGEGAIAEIQGMAGASAANERHQGFDEAIAAAGDKITVVSSQIGDWDTTKAMGIMENILMANPEVKGVFCANDNMAIGAVQACQQNGRSDVIIVGFDAEQIALDAIEEGTMVATVQQQPALMGELGVENALKYLAGEAVEPSIGAPVALVTKD